MSQSYLNGSVYIVEIIAILLEQQEGQECPQAGQRSSSCHLSQGQEDKGTQREHQGAARSYRHHRLGEDGAVREIFLSCFLQENWPLSKDFLTDLKEVFMLFDKDEDRC